MSYPYSLRHLLVGVFVVSALGYFIYHNWQQDVSAQYGFVVHTSISNGTGLGPSTPLYMNGILVGRVVDVYLSARQEAWVALGFFPSYFIPEDSFFSVQTNGLWGKKFVRIEAGFSDVPLHQDSVLEPVQAGINLKKLLDIIYQQAQNNRDIRVMNERMLSAVAAHIESYVQGKDNAQTVLHAIKQTLSDDK